MKSEQKRWRWLLLCLTLLMAMIAASCGSDSDGSASKDDGGGGSDSPSDSDDDGAEPQTGGTLTFQFAQETRSMDPFVSGGSAWAGEPPRLLAVYDGIVILENETNEIRMGTAESLETDDNVTWTLQLRDGIEFTDGTPYDAEAVKFNWERHGEVATSSAAGVAATVESIEVVDPLTLEVTLVEENGAFPQLISATSFNYVASPTAIEESGEDFGTKPVGAGPFIMTDWLRDSKMVLERNPDYWDAPGPYLDKVILEVISEEGQRVNSLKTGESDAALIQNPTNVNEANSANLNVVDIQGFWGRGLVINQAKEPFGDPEIRTALWQAIDQEQFSEAAFQGQADPAIAFFPEGHMFHDPEVTLPPFDPDAAQAVFDAYADETGGPLKFSVNFSQSPEANSINNFLTGMFAKYDNLDYTGHIIPQGQLVDELRNRSFDLSATAYLGVDPEPNFTETFLSTGTRNNMSYENPELDEALLRGRNAADVDERKAAYSDAQAVMNEDMPFLLYPNLARTIVLSDRVGALPLYEDGGPLFADAWVRD